MPNTSADIPAINGNPISKISDDDILSCINSMTSCIYIIDANGDFVYANDAYLKLWGISKESMLRMNVHRLPSETKPIIADIVFKEKRTVSAFQNVDTGNRNLKVRQYVTETPSFDSNGEITFITAKIEVVSVNDQRQKTEIFMPESLNPDGDKSIIVANSPEMKEIINILETVKNVDSSVLITGESGTGKEVIARELHRLSNRSSMPFVDINCAAIPENLLEAELFGYEKGSFTGASESGKHGLIEEANGGFLFLDEINSMPLALQGKLLRAIESKSIRRIGGVHNIDVDFRIVSATSKALEKMCYQDQFRSDLFYRLNVIPINLPTLKERREDIIPLATSFLNQFCEQYGKAKILSEEAKQQLLDYDWPGNIRQLKNLVERTLVTCADNQIEIKRINDAIFELKPGVVKQAGGFERSFNETDLINEITSSGIGYAFENFNLNEYLENCEKSMIMRALAESKTTYEAAKKLGISQASVVRKRQKYNLIW